MKTILAILFIVSAISAFAFKSDQRDFLNYYKAQYPNAERIAKCNLCHENGYDLNQYCIDYIDSDYDFAAIEDLDSDQDGVSNIDEIAAGTNPGMK